MKRTLVTALATLGLAGVGLLGSGASVQAKPYAGVTGGATFPTGTTAERLGTGIVFSAFIGYQFQENIGVDIEFAAHDTGKDKDVPFDDLSVKDLVIFVNPRLSTGSLLSGVDLFISPGFGYYTRDIESTPIGGQRLFDGDGGFAYQLKGGAQVPLKQDHLDLILQGRLADDFEADTDVVLSLETGLRVNFH